MPRTCTICRHPAVKEIEAAIVAGDPKRDIARRFDASKDAVSRHQAHARRAIVAAQTVEIIARGSDLVGEIAKLRDQAADLGAKAEATGDLRTALMSVRELTRLVELQARLLVEQQSRAHSVVTHPVWIRLRHALAEALRPHPEVWADVQAAITRELEN